MDGMAPWIAAQSVGSAGAEIRFLTGVNLYKNPGDAGNSPGTSIRIAKGPSGITQCDKPV